MRVFGPRLFHAYVMRADADVVAGAKPEMPSDFAEIGILGRADAAVRQGDVEEPPEQIFEHRAIAREQTPDLPSIAVEPCSALARQIEDQPHMIFFARGHLKNFAKGGDLIASDGAVGARHLGAERDYRDRESDTATRN